MKDMSSSEGNPDKINAIVHMKPPQSKKEIQTLSCRIAALNWFMAKLAERSLPFFAVLRSCGSFQWGIEKHAAFDTLRDHIQRYAKKAESCHNKC
jgi:hypothetical protein